MELEGASVSQWRLSNTGKWTEISADVGMVVKDIKAIDPTLRVRYSYNSERFVVYQEFDDGSQHMVTTANQLDQRLVDKIRTLAHPEYDYGAELDKQDAKAKKDAEYKFEQEVGEKGEQLAHALRKDLGYYKDSSHSRKTWAKGKKKVKGIRGYD